MERVGAAAEGGYDKKWQTPQRLGISAERLRARGFEILRDGRLEAVLDRFWTEYKALGGEHNDAFTSAYGWFYHWFNCKGNYKFSPLLAEVFARHGAARFTIVRTELLGSLTLGCRRKISLREAASMCGVSVLAMRSIALALSAEDVEKIARALERSCTLDQASKMLGLSSYAVHQLIKAGIVVPVVPGGGKYKHIYIFRCADIETLIERLAVGAASVRQASRGLVSVAVSPKFFGGNISNIVRLVLDGRLKVLERVDGAVGLQALRVNIGDAAAALVESGEADELSGTLASRLMRLNSKGVSLAIRHGLVAGRCARGQLVVSRKSAEAFRSKYVILTEMQELLNRPMGQVRAFLKRNGIEADPLISKCGHVGYPRAAVEGLRWADPPDQLTAKKAILKALDEILHAARRPIPSRELFKILHKRGIRLRTVRQAQISRTCSLGKPRPICEHPRHRSLATRATLHSRLLRR